MKYLKLELDQDRSIMCSLLNKGILGTYDTVLYNIIRIQNSQLNFENNILLCDFIKALVNFIINDNLRNKAHFDVRLQDLPSDILFVQYIVRMQWELQIERIYNFPPTLKNLYLNVAEATDFPQEKLENLIAYNRVSCFFPIVRPVAKGENQNPNFVEIKRSIAFPGPGSSIPAIQASICVTNGGTTYRKQINGNQKQVVTYIERPFGSISLAMRESSMGNFAVPCLLLIGLIFLLFNKENKEN